jgi:hypothetical protein
MQIPTQTRINGGMKNMKKKIIVFSHRTGFGEHEVYKEEFEFDIDATEEEIGEDFQVWKNERIMDNFNWYEKN